MFGSGVLAVGDSFKELLAILFIVLIPTVPLTFLGRSPATPFAAISVVGSVIAVAGAVALLLVIAVRAVAA